MRGHGHTRRRRSIWRAAGRRRLAALALVLGVLEAPVVVWAPVSSAAGVTTGSFSGGSGTVTVNNNLYAKSGGALTLNVTTPSDTQCVDISGAFTAHQPSATPKSSWSFSFVAGTGDGARSVNIVASPNVNTQNKCTGSTTSGSASYVADNSAPTLLPSDTNKVGVLPPPNAAGWNNSNVTIAWIASDAGSGVPTQPAPDTVTGNTSGTTKTATATDRLGFVGTGSVTIKLDKAPPSISSDANTVPWYTHDVTVNFACNDPSPPQSGIKSCTGPQTVTANGGSATGTAVDNADNSTSLTAGPFKIDKVPPSLSGAPVGTPNAAGWYSSSVAVHWTCSDNSGGSGVAGSCPTDDTIGGEGSGLTATRTISDVAGNSTTATSSPAVNIDKTPPSTDATAPAGWNNQSVAVTLAGKDGLSGVDATYFKADGGAQETYSATHQPAFSSDGIHTLEFWSVDKAGNAEAHKTVQVKIDGTSPTIGHALVPGANGNGWNNSDVTVDFSCDDNLSGIASCGPDAVVATEGKDQIVTGKAVDNAGNSASDPASVSIDKTPPTIQAAADRQPNAAGWYDDDVTVGFTCDDALSGIDTCPGAKTLGAGANQSASGTATDAAGNSASDGVGGVNVDKTAPSLAGAPTTQPNANNWYRDDVMVHWTCSDDLSGVAGDCPADSTVTGEGDELSAAAAVSDRAGNQATATVSPISIDRYAPATSAGVPAPLDSGWYGGPVQVTLSAVDKLSGVDATRYSVDGGADQLYGGPFSVSGGGAHTVTFWSTDKAGNVEDKTAAQNSIALKIDNIPPTITGDRTPANSNGWNNGPVTVSFTCKDAESGIAGCTEPVTLATDGAGQSVTGNAADNAGNTAEATVKDINIDQVAPDLAGQLPDPSGIDPAGAKWYTGDVPVTWRCGDGLSGIDGACPANSTVGGEGRNLGAGPVSVSDKAGNSASASVSNINIDRKGPVITGAATTQPNGDGWYSGMVKVGFSCDDPALADGSLGSGVTACPSDIAITGEGANLSATSAASSDYAGNSTPGRTVGGISIDNAAPVSTDVVNCTLVSGYCNGGSPVSMTISAADPTPTGVTGVSGVKEIRYSKDGGATWTAASGNSVNVPLTLSSSGTATVSYYAVDRAGNAEDSHADSVNYDGTPPDVSHTLTPAANAADWSNADTLVHFSAKDDPGGSGVKSGSVTPDKTYSTETADQLISGSADDVAGNHGTDSFHFHLDRTAPTISGTKTPGLPDGKNGWYTHPVQVSFSCADPVGANGATGSGVAACPDPVSLSQNGASQSVKRSVADKADNSASTTVGGINIDMENPTLTIGGVKDDGMYTLGAVPAPTCNATDSFSGVDTCKGVVSGGQPNGVGTFTYTATATDRAGNSVTQSVTYKVVYSVPANVAFFLQPINDTAHTASTTLSIFKAGQTVPVKFQLKNAAGQVVQANSAPVWLTPAKGNLMTSAANEDSFSATGDSGTTFRWDGTAQQYIYNWNSASTQAGFYWKIGVKLDDGQSYYTDIGLRK